MCLKLSIYYKYVKNVKIHLSFISKHFESKNINLEAQLEMFSYWAHVDSYNGDNTVHKNFLGLEKLQHLLTYRL